MKRVTHTLIVGGLVAICGFAGTGCETKAQTGALVGGGGGAAIGAGIGSFSHARAGEGALIGGAVGAIGGYIVGNEMDKSDQRKAVDNDRSIRTEAPVTKRQIIQWSQDGVRDAIIIDRIQRSGTIFTVRASDENQMRDGGVSEEVIAAMRATGR